MKICYLSDATSIHTRKWALYFAKKGHDVTVLSLREAQIPGVDVQLFGSDELRNQSSLSVFDYMKQAKEVRRTLRRIAPDVVHAQYASNYGALGALSRIRPLVTTIWGSDLFIFPHRSPLHRKLLRYNLNAANVITVSSQVMAEEAEKLTRTPVVKIPFGIDCEKFFYRPVRPDRFVVGITKALEKLYGHEDLLRAYKQFKVENPSAKSSMVIAGKGSRESFLKRLAERLDIADEVSFVGHLTEDEIAELYHEMDVAIFPSYSESFCVSAVEAQACGVPVIATSIGGFFESTLPGKTGFLCQPGDVEAFAEEIGRLYRDVPLREKMGQDGRAYVEERFDIEDNFGIAEKVYEELVGKRAKKK